jgi:acetyl-CoA C-acetyltransferase
MGVCIVGWAHGRFGRHEDLDLEGLVTSVGGRAIEHAGVSPKDIDAAWLGNLNGGFVPDNFCSSFILESDPALRWKPSTRVENACASGSAAVYAACDAIEAGRARVALVVGAEKMTAVSGEEVTRVLANASYVKEEASAGMTFPGIFAQMARQYFARYGDHRATLARIAAKNHRNGVRNPYAQVRKDLGFDFCNTVSDKNPVIADPLRKTDCSLVSDGAAALVLADEKIARSMPRAVRFRSRVQVNDWLPMSGRDASEFEGPRRAWSDALKAAGCRLQDLSLAEVHDCFTIAELLCYEAMGLADRGAGARVLDEGTVEPEGRLPVNVSGGLKAKGHPIGATGVSMHALCAMQLTGQAGEMQVRNPRLAGVFNMGGAAVANYVSVLEPLKA